MAKIKPLLYLPKWIFRGYKTLDDFVHNNNALYQSEEYPHNPRKSKKHKDKYIYILSKYFFDPFKNNRYWLRMEESDQFHDCVFIYQDHEDTVNIDYRWFEVMRRRRRGVYIKDAAPSYFSLCEALATAPIMIPGHYPVYDKLHGKPFSIYGFNDPNSRFRTFSEDRNIDVLFLGKSTHRREEYIRTISKSAKKIKAKTIISEDMVGIEQHIDLMHRTKIAYHIMALGYRSSREWEAMINGALLISDDRTVDTMAIPGMVAGRDFIRFDPGNPTDQMRYWLKNDQHRRRIAKNGFEAAWKVWDGCRDPYMPSRRVAAEKIREAGWDK